MIFHVKTSIILNSLKRLRLQPSGSINIRKVGIYMKKFLSLLLSFCMVVICIPSNVLAANQEDDIILNVVSNNNGEVTVQPRNVDLAQMSSMTNVVKFYCPKGKNIKIHIYVSKIFPNTKIKVHFREGNNYANSSSPVKATWSGEGHKYADLKPNASAGYYSVYLEGAFTGEGAVYTEP